MHNNRTSSTTCWEPGTPSLVDPADLEAVQPKLAWAAVALEAEIVAALDAPKQDHETLEAAFRRKEQEIGVVFARLTPVDSLALERRLNLSLAGDPIAARFARLVPARRGWLIGFLSEMRRRQPRRAHIGARHE